MENKKNKSPGIDGMSPESSDDDEGLSYIVIAGLVATIVFFSGVLAVFVAGCWMTLCEIVGEL